MYRSNSCSTCGGNPQMPYGGGPLTASGAKEMLRDNSAHGHKLTKKQKRYFGYVAGGGKPHKQLGGIQEGDIPLTDPAMEGYKPEDRLQEAISKGIFQQPKDFTSPAAWYEYINTPPTPKSRERVNPFDARVGFEAVINGANALSHMHDRNSQTPYLQDQYSTLNQQDAIDQPQPTDYQLYSKYGGSLKKWRGHKNYQAGGEFYMPPDKHRELQKSIRSIRPISLDAQVYYNKKRQDSVRVYPQIQMMDDPYFEYDKTNQVGYGHPVKSPPVRSYKESDIEKLKKIIGISRIAAEIQQQMDVQEQKPLSKYFRKSKYGGRLK